MMKWNKNFALDINSGDECLGRIKGKKKSP